MTVTTWASALDAYEDTIVALERAAASGEPPVLPPWRYPASPIEDDPTDADRARFAALQGRAEAARTQLTSTLDDAAERIAELRRTGVAARAYGRVDHLALAER